MRASLKDAVGAAAVGGSEAADDELFQDILTQRVTKCLWCEVCSKQYMRLFFATAVIQLLYHPLCSLEPIFIFDFLIPSTLIFFSMVAQSVDAKWTDTCRAARKLQGLLFCALIAAFSVVAVVRAGAGGQSAAVHSSLQAIFFNGRFSSNELHQHTAPSSSFPSGNNIGFSGNSNDSRHAGSVTGPLLRRGVPFSEVASAEEALEYFARILSDLNVAREVDASTAAAASSVASSAQFSSRAVGLVLGSPILKQWRVVNNYEKSGSTGNSDAMKLPCAVSPKLAIQPPCAQGFTSTSRLFDLPAHLPRSSMLSAAYEWRAWPGDLPWKVSDDGEYPAGAYSLELPLIDVATGESHQEGSSAKEGNELKEEIDPAALVRALAAHGWVDSATRGISLEVSLYNPARNRLSAVQLLVELRDGVGVRTVHRLRMHKVNTWNFRPSSMGSTGQVVF